MIQMFHKRVYMKIVLYPWQNKYIELAAVSTSRVYNKPKYFALRHASPGSKPRFSLFRSQRSWRMHEVAGKTLGGVSLQMTTSPSSGTKLAGVRCALWKTFLLLMPSCDPRVAPYSRYLLLQRLPIITSAVSTYRRHPPQRFMTKAGQNTVTKYNFPLFWPTCSL